MVLFEASQHGSGSDRRKWLLRSATPGKSERLTHYVKY